MKRLAICFTGAIVSGSTMLGVILVGGLVRDSASVTPDMEKKILESVRATRVFPPSSSPLIGQLLALRQPIIGSWSALDGQLIVQFEENGSIYFKAGDKEFSGIYRVWDSTRMEFGKDDALKGGGWVELPYSLQGDILKVKFRDAWGSFSRVRETTPPAAKAKQAQ